MEYLKSLIRMTKNPAFSTMQYKTGLQNAGVEIPPSPIETEKIRLIEPGAGGESGKKQSHVKNGEPPDDKLNTPGELIHNDDIIRDKEHIDKPLYADKESKPVKTKKESLSDKSSIDKGIEEEIIEFTGNQQSEQNKNTVENEMYIKSPLQSKINKQPDEFLQDIQSDKNRKSGEDISSELYKVTGPHSSISSAKNTKLDVKSSQKSTTERKTTIGDQRMVSMDQHIETGETEEEKTPFSVKNVRTSAVDSITEEISLQLPAETHQATQDSQPGIQKNETVQISIGTIHLIVENTGEKQNRGLEDSHRSSLRTTGGQPGENPLSGTRIERHYINIR